VATKSMPSSNEPNRAATDDACSTDIDLTAPAGSKSSLGAKSDCNGRPDSDDSVVEAKDEQGPALSPAPDRSTRR